MVQIFGQEAGVWATRNNVGIAIAIPISFTVEVVHVAKDRLYRCGGFAVPPIEDEPPPVAVAVLLWHAKHSVVNFEMVPGSCGCWARKSMVREVVGGRDLIQSFWLLGTQ